MPDKTVNWGVPGDDARYRTRDDDPAGGGDYVVAETLDANGDPVEVLLRWDDTAGEWVSGGPVNLAGNDMTNVGALDAGSVSTDETLTDIIGTGGTPGKTHYASNNHPELPDFQTAVNNADQGDTVVLLAGDHEVSGTQTVGKQLTLVLRGTLVPTGDFPVMNVTETCTWYPGGRASPTVDCNGVTHSSDGIVYQHRQHIMGLCFVWAAGRHGHFFEQAANGDNLNNTIAYLKAADCGQDGIRIENTSGTGADINAMQIFIERSSGCANGVHQIGGFGNRYIGLVENNGVGLFFDGNANQNYAYLPDSESNTLGVKLASDANSNFVKGFIQDGVEDNATQNVTTSNRVETRPNGAQFRKAFFARTTATNPWQNVNQDEIGVWQNDTAGVQLSAIFGNVQGNKYQAYNEELIAQGTDNLPAGGELAVDASGSGIMVDYHLGSVGSDVDVGYDIRKTAGGSQNVVFKERTGNDNVNVTYFVFKRR